MRSNLLLKLPSLSEIRQEKSRRAAERSLIEFTRQAWQVIEPGTPFTNGWHIDVICDHLEAVTAGELRNLLINMPPRHMKSIAVAVMWPVWSWVCQPETRWLFASYSSSLSIRDSLKCRRLIQSEWFQENWGHLFQLVGDQNSKLLFENDHYGYRMATSVEGTTTGHGGDFIVADDPHNAIEAQSEAMRASTLEWWDQAMSTRLNDPRTGAKVIVMQRLHERDLSGHVLEQGGYEHLCLPAEFDGRRIITSLGWQDPRKETGALLWPERFGREEVDKLKQALGEYGTAGQLQQLPAPLGGGILHTDKIKLWKGELPYLIYLVQSYDTAFTEKTLGDPTACGVYGVFETGGKRCILIVDYWAETLGYPALRKRVIEDWSTVYCASDSKKGRKADVILVEAKGSGQSLLQDLRAANVPVIAYNPGAADKISRAYQVAPVIDMEAIYVVESKKFPGKPASWVQPLLRQMAYFPSAEHDDGVDTVTQAVITIRDTGLLEMQVAEDTEEEREYKKVAHVNPYAG